MSVEFGSNEALQVWLDSLAEELHAYSNLPLDVDDFESDTFPTSCSESSNVEERPGPTLVTDARRGGSSSTCFCCLSCGKSPSKENPQKVDDLVMLWSRIMFDEKNTSIVNTTAAATTPSLDTTVSLSLTAPLNGPAASTCWECGESLLSVKAFVSPPGFCEYSGILICGSCFDLRQQVVPWKLLQGLSCVRGNVSRKSSEIIQSKYYSIEIHSDHVVSSPAFRRVESLRNFLANKKTSFCRNLESELELALVSLPVHMRCAGSLYSLGDLMDILSPIGRESRILTALKRAAKVLESHVCEFCVSQCEICSTFLQTARPDTARCIYCEACFHQACLGKSTDGCPLCANLKRAIPLLV